MKKLTAEEEGAARAEYLRQWGELMPKDASQKELRKYFEAACKQSSKELGSHK